MPIGFRMWLCTISWTLDEEFGMTRPPVIYSHISSSFGINLGKWEINKILVLGSFVPFCFRINQFGFPYNCGFQLKNQHEKIGNLADKPWRLQPYSCWVAHPPRPQCVVFGAMVPMVFFWRAWFNDHIWILTFDFDGKIYGKIYMVKLCERELEFTTNICRWTHHPIMEVTEIHPISLFW